MLRTLLLSIYLCSIAFSVFAQPNWIDKTHTIQIEKDIPYGEALDYAGSVRTLYMDIAYPLNDMPPQCGRPLVMIIHGGAWLGGKKDEGYAAQLIADFAARGYVAASISYRLGMFQTEKSINCNISGIANLAWNCLNMADTMEWTRAWYRAVQDGKGAMRYLISQSDSYQIDRGNVFVIGESAGAFNALGVVYLDHEDEKPEACGEIAAVLPPNDLYENSCIVTPGFAESIDAMSLSRPDLGPITGTLHLDVDTFTIKACGDIYGGLFLDLFSKNTQAEIPGLYLFHQPADLVVSIGYQRILQGISNCANQLAGCQSIYGRPYSYGSNAVVALLDSLALAGHSIPDYTYDKTSNNAACLEQILNPATSGHSIDNYALRTNNLATYFASKIDNNADCLLSSSENISPLSPLILYPNPAQDRLFIPALIDDISIRILDCFGRIIIGEKIQGFTGINITGLSSGMYLLQVLDGPQRGHVAWFMKE